MQLGGFDTVVEVDGIVQNEYLVQAAEGGKGASCWIPSQEGKTFTIRWRDTRPARTASTGFTKVDGIPVGKGNIIRPADGLYGSLNNSTMKSHMRVSETTRRPLMFSCIMLTDDDGVLESVPSVHLGSIELHIWNTEIRGQATPRKTSSNYLKVPECGIFHETSKKVGIHCVTVGKEEKDTRTKHSKWRSKELGDGPILTFTFRYRPLDMLKANGIASQGARFTKVKGSCADAGFSQASCSSQPVLESRGSSSRKRRRASSTSSQNSDGSVVGVSKACHADWKKINPKKLKLQREPRTASSIEDYQDSEGSIDTRQRKFEDAERLLANPHASAGAKAAANRYIEQYFSLS